MSCDHTKGCSCCKCAGVRDVYMQSGTKVGAAGPSHREIYDDDETSFDVIINKIRDRKFDTAKRFNARALKFGHISIKCSFLNIIKRIRRRKCTRAKRFNACTGVFVVKVCSHKPPCRQQDLVGLRKKFDDDSHQRKDIPSTSKRDSAQQTQALQPPPPPPIPIMQQKAVDKFDGPIMEKVGGTGRSRFTAPKLHINLPPFAEKIRERKYTKTKRFHGKRKAIEPVRKPGTEDTPYVDNNVYIDWQGMFDRIKSRKYSRAKRFEVKAGFSVIDLRPKKTTAEDTAATGVSGALRH